MPQINNLADIYLNLQTEPAPTAKKHHFLFFLGTSLKFTPRPTAPERSYVRGETFSYAAQVIASQLNEIEAPAKKAPSNPLSFCTPSVEVLDGPTTLGAEVGERIAQAIFLALKAAANGKETLQLSGHSRGAVELTLLTHELARIKEALLNTPEKPLWEILLASPCKLTCEAIQKLINNDPSEDTPANRAKLYAHLNKLKINAFLIDPVPGDTAYALPGVSWHDDRFYLQTPCDKYELLVCRDERSCFFYPIIPKDMQPTILPGHHGTPPGNIYTQQLVDLPASLKGLRTTDVQDLVLCKLFYFLNQATGAFGQLQQPLDLGHRDLDPLLRTFLAADEHLRGQLLLDIYAEVAKNDSAYRYFRGTHYAYLVGEYAPPDKSRYIHSQGPEYSSLASIAPDMQGSLVNSEHAMLYLSKYVDFSQEKEADVQVAALACTLKNIIFEMRGDDKDIPLLSILSSDTGRERFFSSLSILVGSISQKYFKNHLSAEEKRRLICIISLPFTILSRAKQDTDMSAAHQSIIEQCETVIQDSIAQTIETHYSSILQQSDQIHHQAELFLTSPGNFVRVFRQYLGALTIEGDLADILDDIQTRLSALNPVTIEAVQLALAQERGNLNQNQALTDTQKEQLHAVLFGEQYVTSALLNLHSQKITRL